MQFLKFLVIGMGILIVLGVGGLIYAVVTKADKLTKTAEIPAEQTPVASPLPLAAVGPATSWQDSVVNLPTGLAIRQSFADRGYLFVEMAHDNMVEMILVLDPASGKEVGRFQFQQGQ